MAQIDGKVRSKYCGNRWCVTCNRIRTARAIDAYGPIIGGWGDPHLVTLTVRNCEGEELRNRLDLMTRTAYGVGRAVQRTHGLPVQSIRKTEVTHNWQRQDFHPHFHLLVDGAEQSELLRSLWLRRLPDLTDAKGQDVRRCDATSLRELFKYATKLVSRTHDGLGRRATPVRELDTIFQALRGRRIWQPSGFVLSHVEEEKIEGEMLEVSASPAFKRIEEEVYWRWHQELADWVDEETGETLSGYSPSERFERFVDSIESGSTSPISTHSVVTSDGRLLDHHHPI